MHSPFTRFVVPFVCSPTRGTPEDRVEVNAAFKVHRHRHCIVVTGVGGSRRVSGFADDAIPRFGDSEEGSKTLLSRHV